MDEIDQEIRIKSLQKIESLFQKGEQSLQIEEERIRVANETANLVYEKKIAVLRERILSDIGFQFRDYVEVNYQHEDFFKNFYFLRSLPSAVDICIFFHDVLQFSLPDNQGEFSSHSLVVDDLAIALATARRMFLQKESKAKELQYKNIEQPEPCADISAAIRQIVQDEIAAHVA